MPRRSARTRTNPKRRKGSRPTNVTTREERIASLRWNIGDAHEALKNAVSMRKWDGVVKYAKQLKALEQKLYDAENPAPRRRDVHHGFKRAGDKYGRGRLP